MAIAAGRPRRPPAPQDHAAPRRRRRRRHDAAGECLVNGRRPAPARDDRDRHHLVDRSGLGPVAGSGDRPPRAGVTERRVGAGADADAGGQQRPAPPQVRRSSGSTSARYWSPRSATNAAGSQDAETPRPELADQLEGITAPCSTRSPGAGPTSSRRRQRHDELRPGHAVHGNRPYVPIERPWGAKELAGLKLVAKLANLTSRGVADLAEACRTASAPRRRKLRKKPPVKDAAVHTANRNDRRHNGSDPGVARST